MNPLLDPYSPRWLKSAILKIDMTSFFSAEGGPIWIKFRRLVQNDRNAGDGFAVGIDRYCLCIPGRRHLRSADRGHLDFPRVKLASYGGRSFAYAGPSNWNSLPAYVM